MTATEERGLELMKREAKPITRALVKKYFGKRANVYGFDGWYRITTPRGGLVRIGPGQTAKIIYGGDNVYAALIGLLGECWGELKAGGLGLPANFSSAASLTAKPWASRSIPISGTVGLPSRDGAQLSELSWRA